jgi:hypothetical protein
MFNLLARLSKLVRNLRILVSDGVSFIAGLWRRLVLEIETSLDQHWSRAARGPGRCLMYLAPAHAPKPMLFANV